MQLSQNRCTTATPTLLVRQTFGIALGPSMKKTSKVLREAGFKQSEFEIKRPKTSQEATAACQILVSPNLAPKVGDALFKAGYTKTYRLADKQLFCTDSDSGVKYFIPLPEADFPLPTLSKPRSVAQKTPFLKLWDKLFQLLLP